MLRYNLFKIMRERGIDRPLLFLIHAGIARRTASRLVHREMDKISVKHLTIICTSLNCTPNDLFEWHPVKGRLYPEDFALNKLIPDPSKSDLMLALKGMPLDKFQEMYRPKIG